MQDYTVALTRVKEQQEAAAAERLRLAEEAAAQTRCQAEADQLAIDQLNADSAELVSASQAQWTAVLNGMRYVPVPGSEPTTVQQERQDLADILLDTMRAVIWNSTMGELHSQSTQQLQHDMSHNVKTLAAAVKVADNQLKQLDARIATLEARPPQAAPGCTTDMTDMTKQLNGRIDHVVNLIGDIGVLNGPDTISSTVAAIKTDITKLQTRPDAATKNFKMPQFTISKFDDYNKTDALTWWQGFLTEASCRTVPAEDMLKALYLQLIGGAQAWLNHLAATKQCTIAELHTHITWKEFEQLWITRFMVRNVVKAAMNEVYTCSQGSMPTRDLTIKWQKIVTTPGFDLSFTNQRSEFFSRSCAGLRSALGNEYDYTSFQAILDRANLVIQTDDKAANEKQSQPHYVAKQGYQRPAHNNAVISEETVDLHAAAASSSDGGIVAALPPKLCHRNKGRSQVPFGELKPLPIPRALRLSIAMDVTRPFPWDRHGHDGILTVVDRLSKYAHFLPCNYHAAAPELARLLHTGWIINQGVPEDIVSDRDTRFMSAFWTSLMAESGTTMKPSSSRHPQTDGQTERAHQTAHMMLCTLICPDQKDWVDRLPDVEFAYNTSVHPAICVTPFQLHHGGEKARIFADLLLPQAADIDVPCSPASVRKYRDLLIKAHANMQKAQIRMQQQANRRRLPCPFREGDLIWVLSEEFALEQDVSCKLLRKWFGPWEVTSAVGDDPAGPSFVINIPPHLTVHRVFHASKLAIYTPPSDDEFPGRRSQDPPSMDGHHEVDRVITHRKYGNKPMQFKVTFKQCAPDDTRWISSRDLQTFAPLIFTDYEKRRLAKEAARPARPTPVVVAALMGTMTVLTWHITNTNDLKAVTRITQRYQSVMFKSYADQLDQADRQHVHILRIFVSLVLSEMVRDVPEPISSVKTLNSSTTAASKVTQGIAWAIFKNSPNLLSMGIQTISGPGFFYRRDAQLNELSCSNCGTAGAHQSPLQANGGASSNAMRHNKAGEKDSSTSEDDKLDDESDKLPVAAEHLSTESDDEGEGSASNTQRNEHISAYFYQNANTTEPIEVEGGNTSVYAWFSCNITNYQEGTCSFPLQRVLAPSSLGMMDLRQSSHVKNAAKQLGALSRGIPTKTRPVTAMGLGFRTKDGEVAVGHVEESLSTFSSLFDGDDLKGGRMFFTDQVGAMVAAVSGDSGLNTCSFCGKTGTLEQVNAMESTDSVVQKAALYVQQRFGWQYVLQTETPPGNIRINGKKYFIRTWPFQPVASGNVRLTVVLILLRSSLLVSFDHNRHIVAVVLTILAIGGFALSCFFIFLFMRLKLWQLQMDLQRLEELEVERKLEMENDIKTAFLSRMSHELRTPVACIIAMLDSLQADGLMKAQEIALRSINKCAVHLLQLLNSILYVAKEEAGTIVLENENFNIREELESLVDMFAIKCQQKGLEIVLKLADDIPEIVRGDQARIMQIFSTLIGNATKFTPSGCIVIRGQVQDPDQFNSAIQVGSSTESAIDISTSCFSGWSGTLSTASRRQTVVCCQRPPSLITSCRQSIWENLIHFVNGCVTRGLRCQTVRTFLPYTITTPYGVEICSKRCTPQPGNETAEQERADRHVISMRPVDAPDPVNARAPHQTEVDPSSRKVALEFEVEDTGPGIPTNLAEKLFQDFVQGDGSMTRRHGGSGLGLCIAQSLLSRDLSFMYLVVLEFQWLIKGLSGLL
ncbi:hypothetical protein CBR_g8530 [Chara braunii]|uniref:histidine kinase n=1 Tax=Chara braunii TaxID=69332 RepID=A0A388KMK5_CHABU|nr:hypothetical protein CBR_g8530 [Chara braunii]|eukprot:GBG71228.1 hypothetical protein CBR_g8530 [Chara braunii]